jgi:uncharacterized sulfatase
MHGFHSHLRGRSELARDIAVYYGMVSCLDKYVGAIVDALDKKGLAENTLVLYTSDHGHFFGQHGLVTKGAFHYEDVIRVPFIARWPGHVPAGQRSNAIQSLVDLPQSFLSVCGIPAPRSMTGVDQSAVWLGREPKKRDFALVENHHQPTSIHCRTYVDQRYKITMYWNRDYGEIFDLECDPGEIHNLWDAPEARELKADLTRRIFFAEVGKEPVSMPRICSA